MDMNTKKSLYIQNGVRKTKSLFIEHNPDGGLYTLKKEPDVESGTPSLYQLYMKVGDPTEYRFVEECLYDWKQWELLCKAPFFRDLIEEWRKELSIRVHSQLVSRLLLDAEDDTSNTSTSSTKYLLDKYFRGDGTPNKGPGRPKKTTPKDITSDSVFEEDSARIRSFLDSKTSH